MASSSDQKQPTRILGHLFLGSKHAAKAKEVLTRNNIKYILNCTPKRTDDPEAGCPNYYEKEGAFTYKRIPIFDNKGEDILPHLETAFRFIEEGKHYGNVLVHCHKGISRSSSFVLAYLMKYNEFTYEEALSYVQSLRPEVQPNSAFVEQLGTFEQQLVLRRVAAAPSTNANYDVSSIPQVGPSIPVGVEGDASITLSVPESAEDVEGPSERGPDSTSLVVGESDQDFVGDRPTKRPRTGDS